MSALVLLLQAAAVFNLACSSTDTWRTTEAATGVVHEEHFARTLTFRVDAAQKLYCLEDCGKIFPIESASPKEIVFKSSLTPGGSVMERRVNLVTGAYHELIQVNVPDRPASIIKDGVCRREAFTGFPEDSPQPPHF